MKSVGARLAFWYALASVLTLACLFWAGRFLLERHVIRGLELLNEAEFEQISHRLGDDYSKLTRAQIEDRLREISEFSSVLFYVEIHQQGGHTLFRSRNLNRRMIPDGHASGARHFNVQMDELGELRASEFFLGPLEVIIATSKRQVRQVMIGYERVFAGLLVVMVVASSLIGFGLSKIALRPVRLIQETANHISSDNLSERIPVGPVEDEISDLARLLNQMFDRLESSFRQIRQFTAEASHELKTPLSLVRLQTEKLLVDGGLTPAQEEGLQVVLEEINRLNKIIEELLFLSRAEADAVTLTRRSQSPRAFLETFIQDARVLADSHGVRLAERIEGDGPTEFDARWLRQVLLNLLANALNYTAAGSTVTLTSEISPGLWRVALEDEGPGVPAEQRERIFERFVRLAGGTQHDKGSGLGLAISRSIVMLHQGRIRAEEGARGRGLRVVFEIPRDEPRVEPGPATSRALSAETAEP
ncbi:MAG: cusS [Verrucomicrobia bacterium]|nr:cusS [Verrucomicrobiota bacterium]